MRRSTSIGYRHPARRVRRRKPEVVGKAHARGQDLGERENLLLGIKSVLVAAAIWRLDDDLQGSILFID